MSLLERVRGRLNDAMKGRRETEKSVLRCVLGDVDTIAGRGDVVTDATVESVIRKIVQGNEETSGHLPEGHEARKKLGDENAVLAELLPQTLSPVDIVHSLVYSGDTIVQDIRAAKSDGQATGLAMKWFRGRPPLAVNGSDVAEAVKAIRLLVDVV